MLFNGAKTLMHQVLPCISSISSNLTSSFSPTSNNFDIFINISNGGCEEFVHHFETVVGAHPSCFDNHRFDFFFSANITLTRFKSLFSAISYYLIVVANLTNYYETNERIAQKTTKNGDFSEYYSFYTLLLAISHPFHCFSNLTTKLNQSL